jgi:hypothetical protein
MRNTATHVNDGAPYSKNGSFSDDGSTSFSTDDDTKSDGRGVGDRRERSRRHRRGGSGAPGDKGRRRNRGERRGTVEKIKIFSPVVVVLLIGVLLALLNVFYIIKHLDESSSTDEVIPTTTSLAEIQSHSVDNSHDKNNNSNSNKNKNIDSNNPIAGREEIIKIITDAGISFDPVEDSDLIEELPLWSEVTEMYGTKPVLHGFNEGNCQRFQASSDPGEHFLGTAGTFNTGTNLMSELLIANCMMPKRMKKYGKTSRGVRWQVSL